MTKRLVFILAVCLISLLTGGIILYSPAPKRYAVFAGYNKDGKVKPYVTDYLKGLNEVTDGVVYITDSPLSAEEEKKVAPYIIHGEYIRHKEYDWGSYKRGFNWLKNNGYLEDADEIVFANDSTFAPLQSFKPMFEKMASRPELDFWGNTKSTQFFNHIQSYFFVIRKPVIRSKAFHHFLNEVKHQIHYSLYITEYEIQLTPYLIQYGYKWDSYIPHFPSLFPKKPDNTPQKEDPNAYPLTLTKVYNNQFLKRRTFTTLLEILEYRGPLLTHLKHTAPKTYRHITTEFPETRRNYPHL